MCNEVVRLKPINPREVWPNETDDFTPWLVKEENLSFLAETLGMSLKVEGLEVKLEFGGKVDLLCRNTEDNSQVLVENQLTETDSDHLARILMYYGDRKLDAVTSVIWIAKSFRNEHRAVFERLNKITEDRFRFFGVEISVRKLADSPPYGVEFNVVVKPHDGEQTELLKTFWSEFRRHLTEVESSLKVKPDPTTHRDYLGFDFNPPSTEIWLAAWREREGKKIAANFHLQGRKAASHLHQLEEQRSEIESSFDQPLVWNQSPKRVGLAKDIADPTNEADWPDQFEWLRSNLEKLNEVFQPIIAEF